jgi:hypothetical protein
MSKIKIKYEDSSNSIKEDEIEIEIDDSNSYPTGESQKDRKKKLVKNINTHLDITKQLSELINNKKKTPITELTQYTWDYANILDIGNYTNTKLINIINNIFEISKTFNSFDPIKISLINSLLNELFTELDNINKRVPVLKMWTSTSTRNELYIELVLERIMQKFCLLNNTHWKSIRKSFNKQHPLDDPDIKDYINKFTDNNEDELVYKFLNFLKFIKIIAEKAPIKKISNLEEFFKQLIITNKLQNFFWYDKENLTKLTPFEFESKLGLAYVSLFNIINKI